MHLLHQRQTETKMSFQPQNLLSFLQFTSHNVLGSKYCIVMKAKSPFMRNKPN